MAKRSKITRDLRSPKYRQRIVPNKKKAQAQKACRKAGTLIELPADATHTIVSNELYEALTKILQEPTKPNKKLIELMRSTQPTEKP